MVGYHGLAGRDFALPHMQVVEFGDLLGLLKGLEQELARFDAAPEKVIQERLAASEAILADLQPGGGTRLLPENMGPHLPLNPLTSVQRFDGRDLDKTPHIAVLGSCKLGNFVATLPLLRLLRRRYPGAQIDFWGSEATADFERALCGDGQPLNWRISWDQPDTEGVNGLSRLEAIANAATHRHREAGPLDLAINCDGFNPLTQTLTSWLQPTWVAGGSLRADGRGPLAWGDLPQQRFLADPDWDSPGFLARYAEQFNSNYIAELLCQWPFLNQMTTILDLSSTCLGRTNL